MRKTTGKHAYDEVLLGDRDLAAALAAALRCQGEVDRWAHGFHSWPAGLHPDAAQHLVALAPGQAVLDPFCGGGTVLVEARAAGRSAIGRDLSPVALRVAAARTPTPDDATLTRFRSTARRLTAAAREATEPAPERIAGALEGWYAPYVLCELASLLGGIASADPEVRGLLEATLSSILVKVSWRQSDTSARRVKHRRPPGTAAILFHKKARELARRLVAYREAVPDGTPACDLAPGDARHLHPDIRVDAVITSPPYPSTYDYLPMQHLRTVWFGDVPDVAHEIGARRHWRDGSRAARRRWRDDTRAWTAAAARALRPGGALVVVIGDGLGPSGPIDASGATEDAALAAGLTTVARASVQRDDHARRTVRWEHAMLYRSTGS